jgi:thymidine kinase
MAQLYYRYSTMNAGKSLEVIKVANNYEERGKTTLCMKPAIDDRDGDGVISSRIGVSHSALMIHDDTDIMELFMRMNARRKIDCVLIDECQFLKKHHVQELAEIVDSFDVPVLAYGLKNDFRNELFEGAYYLLVYADKIEEIKTICWCGRKATMIARVEDGRIIKHGDQIKIGGNDLYVSLCRKHYNDGRLGPDRERN